MDNQFTNMLKGYLNDAFPLEDMLYVKGKVAIVTGGTSGLGFCVAQRLCQGGAKVVIASSTNEKGKVACDLLKAKGYQVSFCKTDVCKESDVEQLVSFTAKTYGSVDILVTSAGIWSYAHIQDMPEEEFVRTLDVNVVGTFRCAKHASKYMIEHKVKGKLVLISSNSTFLTYPVFGGYPHYATSKGGVVAMTQELAKELKRYGIMVNTVAPGFMPTPGTFANGPVASLSPEKQQEIMDEVFSTPMDVAPTTDSVAIVVYGLCTNMADGVTGECVVADSGMMRNIYAQVPAAPDLSAME